MHVIFLLKRNKYVSVTFEQGIPIWSLVADMTEATLYSRREDALKQAEKWHKTDTWKTDCYVFPCQEAKNIPKLVW